MSMLLGAGFLIASSQKFIFATRRLIQILYHPGLDTSSPDGPTTRNKFVVATGDGRRRTHHEIV